MSVAFGVRRRLEDGVGQRDSRLQVGRPGTPQGLVPREFGSGKVHLFQTIHGDDYGEKGKASLIRAHVTTNNCLAGMSQSLVHRLTA